MRLTPLEEERLLIYSAVRETRGLTRESLARNRATAAIEIDRVDGSVTLDGRALEVAPVSDLPLNRRYFVR